MPERESFPFLKPGYPYDWENQRGKIQYQEEPLYFSDHGYITQADIRIAIFQITQDGIPPLDLSGFADYELNPARQQTQEQLKGITPVEGDETIHIVDALKNFVIYASREYLGINSKTGQINAFRDPIVKMSPWLMEVARRLEIPEDILQNEFSQQALTAYRDAQRMTTIEPTETNVTEAHITSFLGIVNAFYSLVDAQE